MSEQSQKTKESRFAGFFAKALAKKAVTATVLIAVVCAVGIIGMRSYLNSEVKTTKLGFEDIGELATQAAYSTQVNVTEAYRDLFGIAIPFTQSKYIYSYDVVIKAGLDFGEIQWEVDEDTSTILVSLPAARILSSQIDLGSFQVYHESESIFRPITLEENNAALAALKQNAETDAVANGLLDNARGNVETILRGFFGGAYDLEKYTIKFVSK